MRLKSIKLAGFKSFVDPTTVDLKSNLVAVVGPNGSGKSNIIDAVRWVMGESSAKYLRGESMSDVIFNGSSGRKPAAHASIELVFDNPEGRLGGQYANYATLSLKREVTRDGQSNYYLNNTRCRRKDIKDIFLGTGLGARSYSIIMQDTISRLIEAKPEDFRAYIEEVAGISKYKERRHETELRIKHTRENLERLTDLRDELGSQLRRLDRQAKAAERYKVLKAEERLTKAQLYALQWQNFDQQLQQQQQSILEFETKVDAAIAVTRKIDAESEEKREMQIEANEAVNTAQASYYAIGADISKIEQAKQHQQERLNQMKKDYAQVEQNFSQLNERLQVDKVNLDQLLKESNVLQPNLAQAKEQAESMQEYLLETESAMQEWQNRWDRFNENFQQTKQKAQVEHTRIQHLQQRRQELSEQFHQLQEEKTNIQIDNEDATVIDLQDSLLRIEQQQEILQQQSEEIHQDIQSQRENLQQVNQQLDVKRNQLQQARGKYASLEALQQAALSQKDSEVLKWLEQYSLKNNKRLAESLRVKVGWEKAVETVLGNFLDAVCVEDLNAVTHYISELKQGNLTLVSKSNAEDPQHQPQPCLADYVEVAEPAIKCQLKSIIPVISLEEAVQKLTQLEAGQTLITQDGIWLGQGWVRVAHGEDNWDGVIERQKQLSDLQTEITLLEQAIAELEQSRTLQQEQLLNIERQREELTQQLRHTSASLAEQQTALKLKKAEIKQQQERYAVLHQALHTAETQLATTQQALELAEASYEEANELNESFIEQREAFLSDREKIREELDHQRQRARECNDQAHALALRFESVVAQISNLEKNVVINQEAVERIVVRKTELENLLDNADNPINELENELEILLEKRLSSEQNLSEVRQKLASIDHDLRELTHKKHEAEDQTEELRRQLEQKRMNFENVKVRRNTIEEHLQEMNFNLKTVLQEMPQEAEENSWQNQLNSIVNRIERLGAINLAAIDEFKEVSERKAYLDTQNEDLEKALQTLENAISKIDKETKQKFKETFDKVNEYFTYLFPKIFGGGSSSLELTSEDLLETGVVIMARPPGKRNSTIHLLSGGEKALTALALVFSLFQINPAPFCMLDEVDAPLDDANVGRFCNLVKEMAKETQFIFISHNKLAIEMADHLIGVTMREPGVSRLVAVDVQEAVQMAEAS